MSGMSRRPLPNGWTWTAGPDRTTHVQSVSSSPNSLPSVYKKATRGEALNSSGARGQGVTVALIDTGVSPLPDVANALVRVPADPLGLLTAPCVNLTDESSC